jgi:hypothetical protein
MHATFIVGSGGNDTCKCHKWSYMTYLAHVYLVSIYSMLYWSNRHAAMMICRIVIAKSRCARL